MIGGLRGNSELSNGFELKNDELLALLELLDAAGVKSWIFEKMCKNLVLTFRQDTPKKTLFEELNNISKFL